MWDPTGGQNCAFFTFDMLSKTLNGVTSPITVTFFAAKSMLNEVTPAHTINIIMLQSFQNQTVQERQSMLLTFHSREVFPHLPFTPFAMQRNPQYYNLPNTYTINYKVETLYKLKQMQKIQIKAVSSIRYMSLSVSDTDTDTHTCTCIYIQLLLFFQIIINVDVLVSMLCSVSVLGRETEKNKKN